MSQKEVYAIIRDLGGKATPREIIEAHEKLHPDSTLGEYVWTRLKALRDWGYLRKNSDGSYSIIAIYEDQSKRK